MYRYPNLKRRPKDASEAESATDLVRGFVFEGGPVKQPIVPNSRPLPQPASSLQPLAHPTARGSLYEDTPQQFKTQMRKDLAITFDSIFVFSPDGKAYQEPLAARGVPEPGWLSLEKLLLAEQDAQQKKKDYRAQAEAFKIPKTDRKHRLRREEKIASDDCSKYAKIREIFGNGNGKYHPNQLVAKKYLPPQGLCEKELLYKLALKISNLQELYQKKKLAMDPYEFYRWVISKNLKSELHNALNNSRNNLTGLIRTMGDDGAHTDQIFRTIVLYWASITGNERKFGKAKKSSQQRTPRRVGLAAIKSSRVDVGLGGKDLAHRISKLEMKRRKRLDLAAQPQLFGGVNAHRAQMKSGDQAQVMG